MITLTIILAIISILVLGAGCVFFARMGMLDCFLIAMAPGFGFALILGGIVYFVTKNVVIQ